MIIVAGLFILLGLIILTTSLKAVGIFFVIFGITVVILVIPRNTLRGILLIVGCMLSILALIMTLFSMVAAVVMFLIAIILCFISWIMGPITIQFIHKRKNGVTSKRNQLLKS